MRRILLILILCGIFFTNCESEHFEIDTNNLLIGTWVRSDFNDQTTIYKRDDKFTDNYCYNFKSDGTLIERQNSGFCGTPPISYADYSGIWEILNDTLIRVKVGYWGGKMSYRLDIESVDQTTLKVVVLRDSE